MSLIMIKMIFLFICFVARAAYTDPELEGVWSSISDLTNPTFEDYKKMETYLREGKRPYLEVLSKHNCDRLKAIRNFKFVGDNGEMPLFEKHSINVMENTNRCILLFGSYNGLYPKKVRRALDDLQKCGYSGDVLVRIGGYPYLSQGGMKISHVPYAFKVAFLKEAQMLGYKEVLWMDTAMNPLKDLKLVFQEIQERGYFFTWVGSLQDNYPSNYIEAAEALNISPELYDYIHHIASGLIGVNFNFPAVIEFLEEWYHETENVFPNISGFPEELSLSVTAWRANLIPVFWFGQIVCSTNELYLLKERPTLQFFIDTSR